LKIDFVTQFYVLSVKFCQTHTAVVS